MTIRGHLELQEAKARILQRRNQKFSASPGSPGAFSATNDISLELTSTSPFAASTSSPIRRDDLTRNTRGSPAKTIEGRDLRPHVRTYLFEHQLETSNHLAQDAWKAEMEKAKEAIKTLSAKRSEEMGTVGTSTSRASGEHRATSRGSQETSEAKPQWLMEQEERVNFNKQMGVQQEVHAKDFEYYRTAATTPYMQASRLQGL